MNRTTPLILSALLRYALVALPTGLLIAGCGDTRGDREKLQGTWRATSLERGGKAGTAGEAQRRKLVVDGNTITLWDGERRESESTFKLNPDQKPKEIDFMDSSGEKPETLGIYSLEGDTLKLCFGMTEKDRPALFATKAGDNRILLVFQREKP
jgi:uncharacterized protein (TIGR03067 family)